MRLPRKSPLQRYISNYAKVSFHKNWGNGSGPAAASFRANGMMGSGRFTANTPHRLTASPPNGPTAKRPHRRVSPRARAETENSATAAATTEGPEGVSQAREANRPAITDIPPNRAASKAIISGVRAK